MKELKDLVKRGTWKIVFKEDVSKDSNILVERLVLVIEDSGTDKEVWKTRFFVQGYRGRLKTSLVRYTATSRQQSTKILIGIVALFGFHIFLSDVTRAYLKSAETLMRNIFIKPPPE